jgi:DNA-binding beta-propeller fold protein YncE
MMAMRPIVHLILVLGCLGSTVRADDVGIAQTYPLFASRFVMHPTQPRLFVSLGSSNAVAIIDTNTLAMVGSALVGSAPRGMAFSQDGSKLFVATSGATSIAVLDTTTLQLLTPLSLPTQPFDVEVGLNGRVFATPVSQSTGIMQVDSNTGTYLGQFDFGVFIYGSGLLEISPDRRTLYFANRGLSPGTLAAYDVSTPTPVLLYQNPFGTLGSNGEDPTLSHNGRFISYACGSGNQNYDIFKISTFGWGVFGSWQCGAYPQVIAFSPNDRTAYIIHTAQIDRFDALTFLPLSPIPTVGQAHELIVEPTGRYIFAAFDTQMRAYKTGFGPQGFTPFCFGDGTQATACPCANSGAAGHGCGNSATANGALLSARGSVTPDASGTDTVVLTASGVPTGSMVIFLQGSTPIANGATYGDGVLCLDGTLVRLGVATSSSGTAEYPAPGQPSISHRSAIELGTGLLRYYQTYYRDLDQSFCTPSTFNVTNGIEIGW